MALIGSFKCCRCRCEYEDAVIPNDGICCKCKKKDDDKQWEEYKAKELSKLSLKERLERVERGLWEGRWSGGITPDL